MKIYPQSAKSFSELKVGDKIIFKKDTFNDKIKPKEPLWGWNGRTVTIIRILDDMIKVEPIDLWFSRYRFNLLNNEN